MPKTLLLADDSVTIQRLVELIFAQEGISIVVVGNGDHAVASMRHSVPDIVLADVDMPGLSGYEVARHVKQMAGPSPIPVLLLTGTFEPVDEALAREVGCDGVVTKPFEPRLLVERVRALLGVVDCLTGAVTAPVHEVLSTPPQVVDRLDGYFEELDLALASLVGEGRAVLSEAEPAPLPSGPASCPVVVEGAASPLPGAFSALLAAEQTGSASRACADWLPHASTQGPVSDVVIEDIVRRVLDRLPETVVRDAVTAIASAAAERLVSEEIERIKSNIK